MSICRKLRRQLRKWGAPSPEAQAACEQAEASRKRADADLTWASNARRVADEVAQIMAEHNAANRYDDTLARFGAPK